MTLFYGLLNADKRTLRWTSAGHDTPLCVRGATRTIEEFGPASGLPLGVVEEAVYDEEGTVKLQSGDVIVVGTDGVWEAHDAASNMFGKERLREALLASSDQPAQRIHDAVLQAVRDFAAGHPQDDDITLVVIKTL